MEVRPQGPAKKWACFPGTEHEFHEERMGTPDGNGGLGKTENLDPYLQVEPLSVSQLTSLQQSSLMSMSSYEVLCRPLLSILRYYHDQCPATIFSC